jgi:hypothetical protein
MIHTHRILYNLIFPPKDVTDTQSVMQSTLARIDDADCEAYDCKLNLCVRLVETDIRLTGAKKDVQYLRT